ncbi:MAG: hypothetical protein WC069_05800 [Candidatus Shapirobacteria bacterium]
MKKISTHTLINLTYVTGLFSLIVWPLCFIGIALGILLTLRTRQDYKNGDGIEFGVIGLLASILSLLSQIIK